MDFSYRRFVLGAALLAGASMMLVSGAQAATVPLASHRAIYDLALAKTRSNSVVAARGRVLYDFSGSACRGYDLTIRQVSALDDGEGPETVSDLWLTSSEGGTADRYRFNVRDSVAGEETETVKGEAVRGPDAVAVTLSEPEARTLKILADVVFPIQHMRLMLEAGRAGRHDLVAPVYDGTQGGDDVFHTFTVIGNAITSDTPAEPATARPEFAGMRRWPVTVAYFEGANGAEGREDIATPLYTVSFELYENGVSAALKIDYIDFVFKATMKSLTFRETKPCP